MSFSDAGPAISRFKAEEDRTAYLRNFEVDILLANSAAAVKVNPALSRIQHQPCF